MGAGTEFAALVVMHAAQLPCRCLASLPPDQPPSPAQQPSHPATHLGHVDVHLVPIEVGVVGGAHTLVEAQGAPGHDAGAVGHDGHAVQAGLAVEQHQVAVCSTGAAHAAAVLSPAKWNAHGQERQEERRQVWTMPVHEAGP